MMLSLGEDRQCGLWHRPRNLLPGLESMHRFGISIWYDLCTENQLYYYKGTFTYAGRDTVLQLFS